jgi:transposase
MFVLSAGVAWKQVPREQAARARRRTSASPRGPGRVLERLHAELLRRLNVVGRIDWSAAIIDGTHIRALKRGI